MTEIKLNLIKLKNINLKRFKNKYISTINNPKNTLVILYKS